MENTNWLRQGKEPLFPDLLWSRPENKATAGKLLIVGGNSHGFSAPAAAFSAAEKARIGSVRVILPDSLQKSLGKTFLEAEFAHSTPSGSFSRQALAQLLEATKWADGVLLAGDFGKNSETAIVLEAFLDKFDGLVTLNGDSTDYFVDSPETLLNRKGTALVLDFGRLQALARSSHPNPPLTHSMSLYELVKALTEWSNDAQASFTTYHADNVIIALKGRVSTTPVKSVNLPNMASHISVWWLQNPTKSFEALTTAAWEYKKR